MGDRDDHESLAAVIGGAHEGALVSAMIDALPVALFCKDASADYRFIWWNQTAERWWGLTRQQVIGRNDYDFFPREQADFFRSKDEETMRSGERVEILEEPLDTPKGRRLLHTLKVPLRPSPEHPGFLLGVSWDITEARARERELEHQRALHFTQSRMASLGVMASGIAHEINNPLAVISGWASQLRRVAETRVLEPAFVTRAASKIEETVVRIGTIVRGLRTLARDTRDDPSERFQLGAVIEETLALCRARFEHAQIELTVCGDASAQLEGRPAEIAQVLVNLLNNAYDAVESGGGGSVTLEMRRLEDVVELAVTDSGPGVPKELAERIMEPFFTTKPPGRGTGLGLAISRAILQSHGGELSLEPSGDGARFVVRLPASWPSPREVAR